MLSRLRHCASMIVLIWMLRCTYRTGFWNTEPFLNRHCNNARCILAVRMLQEYIGGRWRRCCGSAEGALRAWTSRPPRVFCYGGTKRRVWLGRWSKPPQNSIHSRQSRPTSFLRTQWCRENSADRVHGGWPVSTQYGITPGWELLSSRCCNVGQRKGCCNNGTHRSAWHGGTLSLQWRTSS